MSFWDDLKNAFTGGETKSNAPTGRLMPTKFTIRCVRGHLSTCEGDRGWVSLQCTECGYAETVTNPWTP